MNPLAYIGKEKIALYNLSLAFCKEFLTYVTINLVILSFSLQKA